MLALDAAEQEALRGDRRARAGEGQHAEPAAGAAERHDAARDVRARDGAVRMASDDATDRRRAVDAAAAREGADEVRVDVGQLEWWRSVRLAQLGRAAHRRAHAQRVLNRGMEHDDHLPSITPSAIVPPTSRFEIVKLPPL
jgi:hypothetical protein